MKLSHLRILKTVASSKFDSFIHPQILNPIFSHLLYYFKESNTKSINFVFSAQIGFKNKTGNVFMDN